jgi:hypothetical protein
MLLSSYGDVSLSKNLARRNELVVADSIGQIVVHCRWSVLFVSSLVGHVRDSPLALDSSSLMLSPPTMRVYFCTVVARSLIDIISLDAISDKQWHLGKLPPTSACFIVQLEPERYLCRSCAFGQHHSKGYSVFDSCDQQVSLCMEVVRVIPTLCSALCQMR